MISRKRETYNKEYWALKESIKAEIKQQYRDKGVEPTFQQIDKVSAMVAKDRLGIGLCSQ